MGSLTKSPDDSIVSPEPSIRSGKGEGDPPSMLGGRKSDRESFHKRHHARGQSDETQEPVEDPQREPLLNRHESADEDPESQTTSQKQDGFFAKFSSAFAKNWKYIVLALIIAGILVFIALAATSELSAQATTVQSDVNSLSKTQG